MNWGSWSNFWAMGGYGFYVWGSYAVCFGALVVELVLLSRRRRRALAELRRTVNRRVQSDETEN
jgi:heme exporter protein D